MQYNKFGLLTANHLKSKVRHSIDIWIQRRYKKYNLVSNLHFYNLSKHSFRLIIQFYQQLSFWELYFLSFYFSFVPVHDVQLA